MKKHSNWTLIIHQQAPHPPSSLHSFPDLPARGAVLTQETFLFLGTFDMACRWRGQGPDSRNTQRPHTHTDPSPPSAAAARSEMETDFSFDVLHCFPPCANNPHQIYICLERRPPITPGSRWSKTDSRRRRRRSGSEGNKDRITPKVPVRGRNRTCRKVSLVLNLNPALPPPCQWLSTLFRFINPVWICNQTSGSCPSSVMLEAGASKWPILPS